MAANAMKGKGMEAMKMFLEAISKGGGFDKHLSRVQLLSGGNGSLEASMKVEHGDCNAGGTLHGAFSALLVDSLSSVGLFSHPSPFIGLTGVSVQMNMTYLKAVPIGEEILIKSNIDRVGKNLAFMTVDILNRKSGEVIAKGTHTKYIGGQNLKANL